ncbi:hypothetical protein D3C73_1285590 [compost metagenome]
MEATASSWPLFTASVAWVPAATLVTWRLMALWLTPAASTHSCAAPTDTALARSASEPAPSATLLSASLVVQVLLPSTVALVACA